MNKLLWWDPQVGEKEQKLVSEVLRSNFLNDGNFTTKFEEETKKILGCKYSIAVTSGTMAMFLSLKALGIGVGDEVIVPDMTFIATANAVEMTGAKPVLVDVDQTLTIDIEAIKKAINKKTRAIIPVHVSGRGADMLKIKKIAKEHNLFVIEDAAEAFMSKYKGKFLGTYGETGCFSFSPPKIITTGQGGMVVTDNKLLYRRLRMLKDQGRPQRGTGGNDIHETIGYNFKLTNLQAAVGVGQLSYLKKRMNRLRRNNFLYRKYLEQVKEIKVFDVNLDDGELPLWTDVLVDQRDELVKYLENKKIFCRCFWFPIHTQKPYKLLDDNFPNSVRLSSRALWLPSAYTLNDNDVKYICAQIKRFFSYGKRN